MKHLWAQYDPTKQQDASEFLTQTLFARADEYAMADAAPFDGLFKFSVTPRYRCPHRNCKKEWAAETTRDHESYGKVLELEVDLPVEEVQADKDVQQLFDYWYGGKGRGALTRQRAF